LVICYRRQTLRASERGRAPRPFDCIQTQHINAKPLSTRNLHSLFDMAWSKTTRITVMLAIDAAFFILELGVGVAVGSLALMADAFHMVRKTSSSLADTAFDADFDLAERYHISRRRTMGCESVSESLNRQVLFRSWYTLNCSPAAFANHSIVATSRNPWCFL
jgi:hypothetical protein